MFEKPVVANEFVITQGEEGDYFYVIEHGLFEIFVNGQLIVEVGNGGSFGELALMYNVSKIYYLIVFYKQESIPYKFTVIIDTTCCNCQSKNKWNLMGRWQRNIF